MPCMNAACRYGRRNVLNIVANWRRDADAIEAGTMKDDNPIAKAAQLRRQADEIERLFTKS